MAENDGINVAPYGWRVVVVVVTVTVVVVTVVTVHVVVTVHLVVWLGKGDTSRRLEGSTTRGPMRRRGGGGIGRIDIGGIGRIVYGDLFLGTNVRRCLGGGHCKWW